MRADPAFDAAIHAPNRLRLCSALRSVEHADFSALRAALQISDASLSKTISGLGDVGYVATTKGPSPSRRDARLTTSVSLTLEGKKAFDRHIAALRQLAGEAWEG